MAIFIMLACIFVLIFVEQRWAYKSLKYLEVSGSCDKLEAEIGEKVTLSLTVTNKHTKRTIFTEQTEYLPAIATVYADEDWLEGHGKILSKTQYVYRSFYLRPLRRRKYTYEFSLPKRGFYEIGHRKLYAGDLLGITDSRMSCDDVDKLVVYPKPVEDLELISVLGSFIGDISVRRFLMEDPVLTVGFNDYTGREPMKSISWTRTAVTGSLQVKNYDHTVDEKVMVVMNTELGDEDELEKVFSTMRSVCEQLESRGIAYSVMTNGRLTGPFGTYSYLPEGLGEGHLKAILFALGSSDYACFQSFDKLVAEINSRHLYDETYIVVSPKLQPYGRDAIKQLNGYRDGRVCFLDCGKGAKQII